MGTEVADIAATEAKRGLSYCVAILFRLVPGPTSVACDRDLAGEVREAMNKSPHVCARARVGERPVSSLVCLARIRARPDSRWLVVQASTDRRPPHSDRSSPQGGWNGCAGGSPPWQE
jgi:hypothetical protein